MINFIQCNHNNDGLNVKIKEKRLDKINKNNKDKKRSLNYIKNVCIEYNIDIRTFILEFLFI